MTNLNAPRALPALTLALMLSGCELLGPSASDRLALDLASNSMAVDDTDNLNAPEMPDDSNAPPLPAEYFPSSSTGMVLPKSPSNASAAGGSYTLNFDEADLGEVAKVIIGDILEQNYVLSTKVGGKVNLHTAKPLNREQLLPTLEMLLGMNGAALVRDAGGVYHIEPSKEALFSADLGTAHSTHPGYRLTAIPVKNISVNQVSELLKPLLPATTALHSDTVHNILLVSGSRADILRVKEVVDTFDISVLQGRSFALYPLRYVDPPTLIDELKQIFAEESSEKGKEFFRFIAIERMNAILAITHQPGYLADIEAWVHRLDKAKTSAGGGVNVYKVQHVDAVELADTLMSIFAGAQSTSRPPSVAPGQTAVNLSNRQATSRTPQRRPAANASGASTGVANVGEVRIIADPVNNSLVIVSTAQEYSVIHGVIKQLDMMPLQVLIDAKILEVTLNDDLKYGVEWFFETGNFSTLLSQIQDGNLSAFGASEAFSVFYTGGAARAVMNAVATKTNVNVVASPSLMVLNNQEASINVGDQVPIATSQSTNLNSATAAADNVGTIVTNNIQMVETGITLNIRPRVNAGGLVIMEVEQEANQAVATTSSTLNSPTIQQRKITTSVAIKDGETIILGGLIRENFENSVRGIPFLSDIPLIGPLFSTTNRIKDKTELVVLITPRVVQNTLNVREVTDEFKRKLSGIYVDKND
ncbi:MAG: type II secretion system secretin GspD [Methylococcales bacterium]|nr:type II secretion system secretin GspD [Methylococcales bacterium]